MIATIFRRRFRALVSLLLLTVGAATVPARAQINRGTPEQLQDVSITEQLDAQIPLDLQFADEDGRAVRLRDYFTGERPVILTLNYYRCPMLCGLILNGMVAGLKPISLDPGEDFEIVTVSFDPLEGSPLAQAKKRNYVNEYGRSSAAQGWHFLTGQRDEIKALTGAVGFHYRWVEERQQWAHPAALIICTPDGRVSRYLGGVLFEPQTMRLSLVEASEGKIGSLFDQVFLGCFHYVSDDGKYTASALGIMRLGGGLTLVILATTILVLWRRDANRRRQRTTSGVETPPALNTPRRSK
ncbi:MAG: SCO family protein [Phycisphaerae bacterium]